MSTIKALMSKIRKVTKWLLNKFYKTSVGKFCLVIFYSTLDFFFIYLKAGSFDVSDFEKNEHLIAKQYSNLKLKEWFYNLFFNNQFLIVDLIYFFITSLRYKIFTNKKAYTTRVNYRLQQTTHGFYINFIENNRNSYYYWVSLLNKGYKYLWLGIRFWFVAIIIFSVVFYYLMVVRLLPFNKIVFEWICLFMFSYWLISGFVFFIKKYQFGKYTSVIQRFWRRSYILFWAIEACLFLVFFYFTINASSEPFYMYDQTQIYKTRLYSWRFFILKLLPITFLIVVGYIFLLSVKWTSFSKNFMFLFLLTVVLTYVVWVEFYQFFHILNFYGNLYWVYDIDEHSWVLENEPRRTRIVNHFNSIMMILKFWHIVFIYAFWIFFMLRTWEIKRIRYPLLSANLQNFIILYIFAWVSMYPWVKFYFRKLLDMPYYWFYLNNRMYGFRLFWNDLKLICYSFLRCPFFSNLRVRLEIFRQSPHFYWNSYNSDNSFYGYRNHIVKNSILKVLNQA